MADIQPPRGSSRRDEFNRKRRLLVEQAPPLLDISLVHTSSPNKARSVRYRLRPVKGARDASLRSWEDTSGHTSRCREQAHVTHSETVVPPRIEEPRMQGSPLHIQR
jgi:hypothetical protein